MDNLTTEIMLPSPKFVLPEPYTILKYMEKYWATWEKILLPHTISCCPGQSGL